MELVSFVFDSLFDEEYDILKLYLCLFLLSDFTRLRNECCTSVQSKFRRSVKFPQERERETQLKSIE